MPGEFHVLLVGDSDSDATLIAHTLASFAPITERVETPATLRDALRRGVWQLVICDAAVPGLPVLDALMMARQLAPSVPFVVVSKSLDEDEVVTTLRAGAADYVTTNNLARLSRVVARERVAKPDEDLARRLILAQEAERRRIARDLHDSLGQQLTAIKLTLEAGEAADGPGRANAIRDAVALVQQTMESVRDVAAALWPTVLDDMGLSAALRWLAERHARWSGLAIDVAIEDVGPLPPSIETACFYTAKEALTNVMRHAGARRVSLHLRKTMSKVELEVVDDGGGFDVDAALVRPASLGLVGMRERVALAGGAFEITSRTGSTAVRVWFAAEEEIP